MKCVFQPTGRSDGELREHRCLRCGFVRWSKYEPHLIHRPCGESAALAEIPGPGTELKKLLASWWIQTDGDCQCDAHADEMNRQGVEWCRANIDTIVDWLRAGAKKRGLPFIDMLARGLVRQAIERAEVAERD